VSAAVSGEFEVEVAYALAHEQRIVRVRAATGECVRDAIQRSALLQAFPEIDLSINAVGVWGKRASLDQRLRPRDRVEIYRPLLADPRSARRRRGV
jgi:uncharacterized protein